MKVKHTLSLLALAASAALSTSAMAQSSITIIGEVGSEICDVRVNGSTSATVNLPKVTTAQLAQPGQTAGERSFAVALTNCDSSVNQVQMNFHSPSANAANGRVASGVNLVSIEIVAGNGQPVRATSTANAIYDASSYGVNVNNGAANLSYSARYYREAGAGAITGNVNSVVNLTVAYR